MIRVTNSVWQEIPFGPQYRFLGRRGTQTYLPAQAVLGKHVHGEIDPHLWHDVKNGIAYAEVVRDTLIEADPDHRDDYEQRAAHYITALEDVDDFVSRTIGAIPEQKRHLVTTHDVFGYLGEAYGARIAGFVTPNPAVEPSVNGPAPDEKVDEFEELGREPTLIDAGPVDIGPFGESGEFQLAARDDTQTPPVWRTLEDLVIHIPDEGGKLEGPTTRCTTSSVPTPATAVSTCEGQSVGVGPG